MPLLIGIGAWFLISVPLGVVVGKFIKTGKPSPEELWSIHHGGGMQ